MQDLVARRQELGEEAARPHLQVHGRGKKAGTDGAAVNKTRHWTKKSLANQQSKTNLAFSYQCDFTLLREGT